MDQIFKGARIGEWAYNEGRASYWLSRFVLLSGPGLRGQRTQTGHNNEDRESYWLSRFVLPSGPEDGINSYVSPIAIRFANGKKLPLGPVYLRSL